jgi:magnesium-transporting ATPase (P-type)
MVDTLDLILRFIDLITITVPPGLPVSMTYGIVFSL